MALELLEDAMAEYSHDHRPSVLDAGTGTGVLAVAALLLGARRTSAFDVDSAAVVTTRRNLQLNGLIRTVGPFPSIDLFVATVDAVKGEYDLVLANLAAPLLLRIQTGLTARVKNTLILSGIADAMIENVRGAYGRSLVVAQARSVDGWHALRLDRAP
jgi:ribosomal protein L11 methyltransferase